MNKPTNGTLKTILISTIAILITNSMQFAYSSAVISTRMAIIEKQQQTLNEMMRDHIKNEYDQADAAKDFAARDKEMIRIENKVNRLHHIK